MLKQEQIKQKIDSNNELIEVLMNPSQFVLNEQITILLQENEKLQEICEHEYIDGICKYCYKIQKED